MRARLRGARREAVERKLRLWSGLLIAAFVVTHLSNHALGLVSIEAMERAREWMQEFWGDPVMLVLLYGSFAIHFWLALVSLYRRTTLRMPAWEAAQLVLGLLVLPLFERHHPERGEANAARQALEECGAGAALELGHGAGERGLGHRETLGRGHDALGLGDGEKLLELASGLEHRTAPLLRPLAPSGSSRRSTGGPAGRRPPPPLT